MSILNKKIFYILWEEGNSLCRYAFIELKKLRVKNVCSIYPKIWHCDFRCFLDFHITLPQEHIANRESRYVNLNPGIVLVPCHTWKCAPTAISGGVDVSKVPGCHLLWQMSSQWGSQKLLQGLMSHELTAYLYGFNLYLTLWIMAILSKGCKPDKFEPHNSLKLSFTNIWGLCSNFV